ncbi:MAG: MFS transporter [Candidatus Omnitrophica bacterium]|nr:MFS transporter [Candidatus Omnitrophota bacterium]
MKKTTFILLCLEGAVLSFNVAACAALIPSIARDFNVASFVAGRAIWLYMLPYGLAALIYGPLVRAFDAKKVEVVCFLLFVLANLLAALSHNIQVFFWARFLMGLFGASVIPLALILISRHIEQSRRGRFVGIFFSATFVASLLGLFLSGIIHWRLIFLIPALFGFILWLNMLLYLPGFSADRSIFKINYLPALKNKAVLGIFTYIFLISLLYHGIQQWLGVYFSDKFSFTQFAISMLITLTSLSGIFGEALGGHLSDKLGRLRVVDIGIALMALSIFALLFKAPIYVLAVAMIIWGLGWTFNHAGLSTMLTDLPGDFLNEAASLNSSVRFVSGGLGMALGGLIMQRSFNAGFLIFGFLLIGLIVFSKSLLAVK